MGDGSNHGLRITSIAVGVIGLVALIASASGTLHAWRIPDDAKIAITCGIASVLLLAVATILWLAADQKQAALIVRDSRSVLEATLGVVVALWGQAFVILGFVSAWRIVFARPVKVGPGTPGPPGVPALPSIDDLTKLLQALTVAPTWLGMTIVGAVLTVVGAWLISRAQASA